MRLVYISSPLRGDVERNIQRARDYCAYAASCGVIPLAPHTIFTQYLDDEQPEQREQGLRMGRDLMWRCDDLWVVGSTISSGMREEIELAKKLYNIGLFFNTSKNTRSFAEVLAQVQEYPAAFIHWGGESDYGGNIGGRRRRAAGGPVR